MKAQGNLTAYLPSRREYFPAGRIALGVGVSLGLLLLLGRADLTIFASFAAFTSIYARHEPLRPRLLHQTSAAALLLLCMLVGWALAFVQAGAGVVILVGAVVAAFGAVMAARLELRPAGALFFIFAVTAVAGLPHLPPFTEALGTALLTALFCVVLGMSGATFSGWVRPGHLAAPPVSQQTRRELLGLAARHLTAIFIAGLLGQLSGFGHSYWAMVAAAAPIAVSGHGARIQRAVHRIVGTLGGIGLTVFLLAFPLPTWGLALLIILLQFLAETVVVRHYGVAMLFVTPLALLMVQLGHWIAPWELVTARAVETVIGAVVGLTVVLISAAMEPAETSHETRAE